MLVYLLILILKINPNAAALAGRQYMMGIIEKEYSEDLPKAFEKWHAIGVLATPEWIISAAYHLRKLTDDPKKLRPEQFAVFSWGQTRRPFPVFYHTDRLFPVKEIAVNPQYDFKDRNCKEEGFLVRLAEKLPYGWGPVQWHRRPLSQLRDDMQKTSMIYFITQEGGIKLCTSSLYSGQYDKQQKSCPYSDNSTYCVASHMRIGCGNCSMAYENGALIVTNNQVVGIHQQGGNCTEEPQNGYMYLGLAADGQSSFSKFILETVIDTRNPIIPPMIKKKSRRKHDIKKRIFGFDDTSSGKPPRYFRPTTSPFPWFWWNWEKEDCNAFNHPLYGSAHDLKESPVLIVILSMVILYAA